MTQKQFDEVSKYFYKLHDIMEDARNIEDTEDSSLKLKIDLIFSYYDYQKEIINKLRIINSSWVSKFDEEKKTHADEDLNLPEIFILFRSFINNIDSENYVECGKIKTKLLNEF